MVYVVLLELKETVYRDVVELYTFKKNGHHNVHRLKINTAKYFKSMVNHSLTLESSYSQ